jgi:hypothetical protein
VLEDHGWEIYRIWTTDWFQRPKEQLQRLLDTVDQVARKAARGSVKPRATAARNRSPAIVREPEGVREETPVPPIAVPYQMASFKIPRSIDPNTWPPQDISQALLRIIQIEGPIHRDELLLRLRDLLSLTRTPPRLQDNFGQAIDLLVNGDQCVLDDECLDLPDRPVTVRSRDNVASVNLRKPDLLPISEIRAAIYQLIDAAHGVAADEVPMAVARVFGLRTTPPALRQKVNSVVEQLLATGQLAPIRGLLQRTDMSPGQSEI